ncbi:uncharacterized protein LOC119588219 [Penaeus monodon]|uniref:uncharacterized protein LOC119588219 n=1 Tax=Penaeus monodon TaxID=6687 RepID=UPI0018A79C18|nr:uncharacterized protein LOC119588219 [Penaeus monodon]
MLSEAILCEERTASHVISSWVVPTFATMLGKYLLVVSLTCCSAGAAADEGESPGFAPIRFIDNQSGDLIHAHKGTKADVISVSNTKDLLYGPYKLFTDLSSGGWPEQPSGGNATTASAAGEGARHRHDRKHRSGSAGGRRRDGSWHRKQRRKKETRKFNNGRLNKKNLKNDWKRRQGNRHNNRRSLRAHGMSEGRGGRGASAAAAAEDEMGVGTELVPRSHGRWAAGRRRRPLPSARDS